MNTNMTQKFDNLSTILKKDVNIYDKVSYLHETFTTMLPLLRTDSVSYEICESLISITIDVPQLDEQEAMEVYDAFLSIYPTIYKKVKDESSNIRIVQFGKQAEFEELVNSLVERCKLY